MKPVINNEAELYFERGGPSYRWLQRVGIIRGDDPSLGRRIVLAILITWVPLLVFSWLDGRALGSTPQKSFLLDFVTYARFFLAVPLMIVADVLVGPRLRTAGLHFLTAQLVREPDYPAVERAVAGVKKWRESRIAELIFVGLALVGAWTITIEDWHSGGSATWHTVVRTGGGISLAGLWFHIVAIPLIQFLWLRWLWRLMIWSRFLWHMSRLDLDLVPTHADGAGALGFLGNAHGSFGVFGFALGSLLSANAAFQMVYEGAKIQSFEISFGALVVVCLAIFLGPLLLFMPTLFQANREWRRRYTVLVGEYNRAFDQKWATGKTPESERLLGSADIQSLADLANSFDRLKSMKFVPFSRRVAMQLAVMPVLPALPLYLLVMPVGEILRTLVKAVF